MLNIEAEGGKVCPHLSARHVKHETYLCVTKRYIYLSTYQSCRGSNMALSAIEQRSR